MDFTCKALYTGIGNFVRCLEEDKATRCSFAVPLGITHFCKSPLWANFHTKESIPSKEKTLIQKKRDEKRIIF